MGNMSSPGEHADPLYKPYGAEYSHYHETDGIEAHLLLALGELLATTAPVHAACHRRELPP